MRRDVEVKPKFRDWGSNMAEDKRTCGNCKEFSLCTDSFNWGWCDLTQFHRRKINIPGKGVNSNCSWKPIPACSAPEKERWEDRRVHKVNYAIGGHEWECIDCGKIFTYKNDAEKCCFSPEKEERLMVPGRWIDNRRGGEDMAVGDVSCVLVSIFKEDTGKTQFFVISRTEGALSAILDAMLTKQMYSTAYEAKVAVEKALGIIRGGIKAIFIN